MSLNIMCVICNEFYNSNDHVYSTTRCGHLFHRDCLFQWLMVSSKTCPQCRQPCDRRATHRVYLNFGERTAEDDEINALPANFLNWSLLDEVDRVPPGAIKCGTDPDGNDAYVARFFYMEDMLPANFVPNKGAAYASWSCLARTESDENEIMVLLDCDCSWVPAANGEVPENAIVTGYTDHGEDLYTGRAQYEGILLGGKVHPSHGVLYMPYKEKEVNVKEYEVLVRNVKTEN